MSLESAVASANHRFCESHRQAFFARSFQSLKLAEQIAEIVEAPATPNPNRFGKQRHQWVRVAGPPGIGKSALIVGLVDLLELRRIPHLALRLDRLEAGTPDNVGRQIRLPESPVSALAKTARDRNCVLVLDELDTVRRASGRPFTECAVALWAEADVFPNMRVVMTTEATGGGPGQIIVVEPLPEHSVRQSVVHAGFDANLLTARQITMLRNPLRLHLMAQAISEPTGGRMPITNAADLFDAFWRKKELDCTRFGLSPERCLLAANRLCEEIDRTGSLCVPETALNDCADAIGMLASQRVLTRFDGRLSFFHETLYDHINARRLLRADSLARYALFLAADAEIKKYMRQTLGLRRHLDFDRYCQELEEMLLNNEVSKRAKEAAVDHLQNLEDPAHPEWDVVARLVDAETDVGVMGVFASSPEWFKLALDSGAIHRWSQKYEGMHEHFYWSLLTNAQRQFGGIDRGPISSTEL